MLFIAIIVFVLSSAGIIFLFLRHYVDLVILNPETIKKPETEARKEQIVEERIRRFWRDRVQALIQCTRFMSRFLKPRFTAAWLKFLEFERQLQKTASRVSDTIIAKREKINTLVEEGYKELAAGNLGAAEGKFIDGVRIDPRAGEVYKGLAEVYVAKKAYREAQESLEFAAKITPHDVSIYRALLEIAQTQEERPRMLAYLSKIVELEPSNPKHLDLLIETSILLGNKRLARQGLERLRKVNPENKKIGEFEERISSLS